MDFRKRNQMSLLTCFWIILVYLDASVCGIGFRGFSYEGLEEPVVSSRSKFEDISRNFIEQPLDHFNHRDNRTWSMRYFANPSLWDGKGPILIMIGGEWVISDGFLKAGLMYEIASAHHALMYYTEHRYYGLSKPTSDVSSESLQYLNVDQALADLAYFIQSKKDSEELKDLPVYVFGGSYAGSMAAWSRLKYPHLIQGALASSAPVYAKADFYAMQRKTQRNLVVSPVIVEFIMFTNNIFIKYFEVVARSLSRYSKQCTVDIKAAFDEIEHLLALKDGPKKLKAYFNTCNILNVNSPSSISYFMNVVAEVFASIVQYDGVDQSGRNKIAVLCNHMTNTNLGTPLERLAKRLSESKCSDNTYENFVNIMKDHSWEVGGKSIMRQWYHQTCTEFGYYQTSSSAKSIFGTLFPLSFFNKLCIDLYGEDYHNRFLNSRIERTNIMYGGLLPQVTNVIFTNGDIDPWHALSVLEDLNESSPAILINGSSHCRDLYPDAAGDVEGLRQARVKVRNTFDRWISSSL